jgi:DUF2075 family protein/predicted GIY-YIG superfamily endonuclease
MSMPPGLSIRTYPFNDELLNVIDSLYYLKDNWPVIYILSNSKTKELYIGETSDFYTRMTTHLRSADKKRMTTVHIIICDQFNKSATLDTESNLIKYISADGGWKLLNLNIGLSNHNYWEKSERYWPIFNDSWKGLQSCQIAHNEIDDLDNSDLFKYSPFKSLNNEQQRGLVKMMETLLSDNIDTVIAEGGAGTGKSLLAIHLFKLLVTNIEEFNYRYFGNDEPLFIELVKRLKEKYKDPKLAMVIPMTSFRSTIEKVFQNIDGLDPSMVIGPAGVKNQRFDIIVVDEAHRLRRRQALPSYYESFDKISETLGFDKTIHTELDWVKKQSDKLILFYDEGQSIRPSDVRKGDFDTLRSQGSTEKQSLKKQMRVSGGEEYTNFAADLLDCKLPGNKNVYTFKKYDLLLFDSVTHMRDEILRRDKETDLSRMVAGFSWKWVSKGKPGVYDIILEKVGYRWNSVTANWINSEGAPNEIGCIHTTQGYDLNYAGIIFGKEINYNKQKNEIVILSNYYFDSVGKKTATPLELKQYIINIYRTVMQRAIKGVYIYAYHPELREYFSRFIPRFRAAP